jgi:hypothetical protein
LGYHKISKIGWLINNRNLFLTVLEAGRSEIKVLTDLLKAVFVEICLFAMSSHDGKH